MSLKSIVISVVLAYVVWSLFVTVRAPYEYFVTRPYEARQHAEKYSHKLRGTPLETTVRDANLFGKTAHAKFVRCGEPQPYQWDYVCKIDAYVIPQGAKINPGHHFIGTKFGLMVDATHITRTSPLYPGDGPDPPFN